MGQMQLTVCLINDEPSVTRSPDRTVRRKKEEEEQPDRRLPAFPSRIHETSVYLQISHHSVDGADGTEACKDISK